ncbi:MAG TPA: sugar transferase [Saprospiraceae bacterium]|nr:sugar transferase [Saprospiraceae bacterium]
MIDYPDTLNKSMNSELTKIQTFIRTCELVDKSPSIKLTKRIGDVVFSSIGILLVLSWFTPILSLIIWLETRQSPFFKQKRTGLFQKNYYCYKFRTMHKNEQADSKAATDGDNRITRTGKFLRVSGIDELPQLFNVFKGDMSIVGPRPHMISDNTAFESKIWGYNKRHFVKPGITGLAQVKGYKGPINSELELFRRSENDILYVMNYSFWFDIKIILLTVTHLIKEIAKL